MTLCDRFFLFTMVAGPMLCILGMLLIELYLKFKFWAEK